MAAYAALVSLMNNMEQIMNHPRLSACLDKYQIEALGKKLDFMLDFIESDINSDGGISKEEVEELESQIASAAHAAEDVIESHIVDQIHAGSTLDHGERSSSFLLDLQRQIKAMKKMVLKVQEKIQKVILAGSTKKGPSFLVDLQKIMKDMDSINEKVMKVKKERGLKDQQPTYCMPSAASSRPLSTRNTTMVGFDDELIQLMDVLTGQQADRQIISIIGMGGMGKTTLARNIYENSFIMQHFDIRGWATISQEYNVREILLELLSCQGKSTSGTADELGEQLHKSLSGRRYLIVLDDMWSTQVWDNIKLFFPNNGNRSRVVLTTRLSNVAIQCGSSCFRMNFLDEEKSWSLFCHKIFGHEDCPPELEKIGKEIAKLCKGLPLSIAVIGGLLQKSYKTIGYWHNVAENINSVLNLGENEKCLNVLYLSYSHLPVHLKPCFLYMGVFDEDYEIPVSRIIKLWVAEGFLKLNGTQIFEEIAEGYLLDLIDRNLILIGRRRSNGKIRTCRVHDLLRDLCLKVAEKEKFFCVTKALDIPQGIDQERRLVFHEYISEDDHYGVLSRPLQSASLVRSVICKGYEPPVKSRLLRVLNSWASLRSIEAQFQNVNLRYLSLSFLVPRLPSSISLIWSLQTLIIRGASAQIVAPFEIWEMLQLRHLECNMIYLPDPPPSDKQDDLFVLGNLRTLVKLLNFRFCEEACKRIPNIKKLHVEYDYYLHGYDDRLSDSLSNLGRFQLESLNISFLRPRHLNYLLKKKVTFPSSLKKLSLKNYHLRWEDLTMIGSLPQLEVLKLGKNSTVGSEWSPINGEFPRLKFLKIDSCDLRYWTADSSHFPVLEKLVLEGLRHLNEIPWGIGEIPTLELIRLNRCSESAIISAMRIKEEQESLGNDGLQIQVIIRASSSKTFRERVEIEMLSINNIQLELLQNIIEY